MTENASFPRTFGDYRLTAEVGRDALGPVFRALRVSGERGFVRLRIFESPEISEDAVLDAIEENGEIHSFLKNPAIARGVQVDSVDGVPFLAWSEPNGRTLDALISKARELRQGIPVGHALLIGEKVATALDHAYNTTLDGERTLHGLVWPGFVSISDDGETRLTGFGLAPGFFPSMSRPRFAREIAPYLAPEERALLAVGKNSDVYSVGVLLFQLLLGRLPSATDPLQDVKTVSVPGGSISPEAAAVLRTCLSPAESRYQSSGDLRRELGKILFSGPYSPSTFNMAFFLTGLFGAEIEAENQARSREAGLDPARVSGLPPSARITPIAAAAPPQAETGASPALPRRFAIGGAMLLAAALAGTVYLITHRPSRETTPAPVRPIATRPPAPQPTQPPTTTMSESQFKEEVARRVAAELKGLEEELQKNRAAARRTARAEQPARTESEAVSPEPTSAPISREPKLPTATPRPEPPLSAALPTVAPTRRSEPGSAPSDEAATVENETAPKIQRVVKPISPPLARQAGIKGIVMLRVLVSEVGRPQQVEVLKGVGGGLTEAAVSAVRKWSFEPARRNGQVVSAWTTIPIPFEP